MAKPRPELMDLWEAQGKICCVCGEKMYPLTISNDRTGWTIEHVYHHASRRYYADGNKLLSHAACNNRKGDREPTGCEKILLAAVNARLGRELVPMLRGYSDDINVPSALAMALGQALAA